MTVGSHSENSCDTRHWACVGLARTRRENRGGFWASCFLSVTLSLGFKGWTRGKYLSLRVKFYPGVYLNLTSALCLYMGLYRVSPESSFTRSYYLKFVYWVPNTYEQCWDQPCLKTPSSPLRRSVAYVLQLRHTSNSSCGPKRYGSSSFWKPLIIVFASEPQAAEEPVMWSSSGATEPSVRPRRCGSPAAPCHRFCEHKNREGERDLDMVTPSPVLEVAKAIILCICDWKHLSEYCTRKSESTRDQIVGGNASWWKGLTVYLEDGGGISKAESRERE